MKPGKSASVAPAPSVSTVSAWIERWAGERPEAPALVTPDTTRTWSDLVRRQDAVAGALRALGAAAGERVACLLGNRVEFLEAFLGTVRLGGVFVPVNTRLRPPEIARVIGDADARVVVTDAGHRHLLDRVSGREVVEVDGWDGLPAGDLDGVTMPGPEDLVAILYTSGTTGRPKGAAFTHGAFFHTAVNQSLALELTPEDRHLVVSPLSFTGGLLTSVQPALFSGGTILLEPDFTPERLLSRMREEGATVFMAVPTMLSLLLDSPAFSPEAFKTIRYLGSGSAPAPLPLMRRYLEFGVGIAHAYGLTEGGGLATQLLPSEAWEHLGSAGRACAFVELRVVDSAGRPAAAGTVGEIWQRGPSSTRGYWRNPEETARLITEDGWVRTGDLGRLDEDGYLTVVGRTKDVVITGGMNVYPADVESVVAAHPSVLEAAVVGVPHPVYGETVAAVVVPRTGRTLELEELREFCRPRLADYKVPRLLRIVGSLPRTASGKVLKSRLRDDLAAAP